MVVGPLHRLQLFGDVQIFAGLEQQDLKSVRGQDMHRHSAGRAGSDDDGIIGFLEIDFCVHEGLTDILPPVEEQRVVPFIVPLFQIGDFVRLPFAK